MKWIIPNFITLGTGHKVRGGGGSMKNDFFNTSFQWPISELLKNIGAAHPWSGTEK